MTTVPGTTPYAWPYDAKLDLDRLALLVCGTDDQWRRRTPLDVTAEANIDRLRTAARAFGFPCFLLRHDALASRRPLTELPTKTPPGLLASVDEVVVNAAGIDGFYGSPLDALLRRAGRSQLLVVGRCLETTVHSTLRSANDAGYECLTAADACAAIDPGCRPAAISSIEMSGGIFGAVGVTASVLAALSAVDRASAPSIPS